MIQLKNKLEPSTQAQLQDYITLIRALDACARPWFGDNNTREVLINEELTRFGMNDRYAAQRKLIGIYSDSMSWMMAGEVNADEAIWVMRCAEALIEEVWGWSISTRMHKSLNATLEFYDYIGDDLDKHIRYWADHAIEKHGGIIKAHEYVVVNQNESFVPGSWYWATAVECGLADDEWDDFDMWEFAERNQLHNAGEPGDVLSWYGYEYMQKLLRDELERRFKESQEQETSRQQAYAAGPEPIAFLSADSDCEE